MNEWAAYYRRGIAKSNLGDEAGAVVDMQSATQAGLNSAKLVLKKKGIAW